MADFLAFVADEVQTIDALVDLLAVEHPTPQLFDADAEQLFVVFLDLSSARFVTWKIFVFPFFLIGVVEVILRAAFCGPYARRMGNDQDRMMVMRSLIIFVGLRFSLSSPSYAADLGMHQENFRQTPKPFRLLVDQWCAYRSLAEAYSLEFLRTADRETAQMTLKEAIFVGLKNNPGIEVDRLEPLRAAEQTRIEKSIFDPTLNLEFHKDYAVDPYGITASPFFQPVQTSQNRDYNLAIRKFLLTGAQFEISFLNPVFIGSLPDQVLKSQYRPRLGFSLTQPLLRDFGWGLTTIFVRIDENREGISVFGYQAKLAQLIQRITEAYWAVVFARENLTVQTRGVEPADLLHTKAEARG